MDLMTSSGAADLGTTGNIEEWSTKEDLEGSVIDDLYLEVDGDRSELDRLVLDESQSHCSSRVC